MTAARRTRMSPEVRRAQLIDLGVEMLATRSLDELSVEEIAQQAGISRGLLFHYFASKHDFHVEVARAAAAEMLRRTAPEQQLPPADALRVAIEAFVGYVSENPDNYKSLVRGAASGDAELRAIFDATRETMAGRIVTVVDGLGLRLGDRAQLAVHGWVAFAEECVVRWIERGGGAEPAEIVGMLAAALPALVLAAGDGEPDVVATLLRAERSPA